MNIRFYIDPKSGLPHIYNHGVDEDEVEHALANRGEDRPSNKDSPWELRLDRFRVFYSIEEGAKLKVVAVGHEEHNDLFIQGKKVQL